MRRPPALALSLVVVFLAAGSLHSAKPDTRTRVAFNDNAAAAGVLLDGELRIALEVRLADWHPLGADKPGARILAFAERDGAASIPGPLIRVHVGTRVRVTITNPLDTTLVVHGLAARRTARMDSLVLPPASSRTASFVADVAGTYYYWGTTSGLPVDGREFEDSQLSGALIVDPPGDRPDDRVFVFGSYFDGKDEHGDRDGNREFLVINGRPWPYTERLQHQLGDSIRWRFINPSVKVHPMHLHGFYFRVDARGDFARDTLYWPAERRMAVTERLDPGSTMSMVWSPERPGGWLFHCHLTYHVLPNPRLGAEAEDGTSYGRRVLMGEAHHDPQHHIEQDMGGLMMLTTVTAPDGRRAVETPRRSLRLFVQSGHVASDTMRRFAFVLQQGAQEPTPDSLHVPGSLIVLQKGEPASIRVINRTPEPTQIHWHGLELDSYFDGAVGVGGHPGMPTPAIMPGDSFEVRLTPPRAGSFMYHTHMSDLRQQGLGLFGALLVVDDRESWNSSRDFTFLAGPDRLSLARLYTPSSAPEEIQAGGTYRLRLMNVTLAGPGLHYWLMMDGAPMRWTLVAKDGHDLAPHQRLTVSSHSTVSIGETLDVEITPQRAGEMWLELRTAAGRMVGRHRLTVVP